MPRPDRPDGPDRPARRERPARPAGPERPDRREKSERSERPGRREQSERSERPAQSERSERPDRRSRAGGARRAEGASRVRAGGRDTPPPRGTAGGRRPKRDDPRAVAIAALARADDGAYANLDLPARLRNSTLGPRERAWVTDAVYGTLRQRGRIDALVKAASTRPLSGMDPPVRAAVRLGTYQLLDGVAPHAAVMETVNATPPSARGFVNAVLRAVARAGTDLPADAPLAARLSYPQWIVDELISQFGPDDAERVLSAMNQPGALTLRINPRRATPDALENQLRARGARVDRGVLVPDALVVVGAGDPAKLQPVRAGIATPQDQASQAVVALLDPQPGERILDLAAAPGGKSTGAAERMGDDGTVVACDLQRGRLDLVREAAGRLHLLAVHAVLADGRTAPLRDAAFDRVLLDAPCTGLGVLRRRAEARWRIDRKAIRELAELQQALLVAAARATRPGGRLVYSVCTLTEPETLGIDAFAREQLGGFVTVEPPGAPWRPHGRGAVILPHDAGTDGMFVLVLERAG